MKDYDDKSINLPKMHLSDEHVQYIKNKAEKKGVKQSKILKDIIRRYLEKKMPKLVD